MSAIRPFARNDLEEVAALYELVMRSGGPPPPGLAAYLQRVLIDQPWADPEIPSLVSVDDGGRIVGFQGSSVRRALFDGRPVRIGCPGQLVIHSDVRHRATGAMLFRSYVRGPQDITITDTAGEPMRRIGMAMGMQMLHLSCIEWVRVLRPSSYAHILLHNRRGSSGRRPLPVGGMLAAVDTAITRLAPIAAPPTAPAGTGESLTVAAMLEHLHAVAGRVRLRLDYDERYLRWLFAELARATGLGTPVARLVRDAGGRVVGWYVYLFLRRGTARVLQLATSNRDAGLVLDHLLRDAWVRDAVAVQGRLEPRLLEPLSRRRCAMAYRGGSLVHSRDKEIRAVINSGDALLTRLDSEWWLKDEAVDLSS